MITNFETNTVYFAQGLHASSYGLASYYVKKLLDRHQIAWEELPSTQSPLHIWSRDYMPVQVDKNKFVQFRYEPDYLAYAPEYKPSISAITGSLDLQVIQSDIVLDGGNIISCGHRVILTDKVYQENPHYPRKKLRDTLSELLEADLVFIPWDKFEPYGHADGMVRYLGKGRVLLNNYCDFDRPLRSRLLSALRPHFEVLELNYGAHTEHSWAYLNFLHVGNSVFVPFLPDKLAYVAFRQIQNIFARCRVIPMPGFEKVVKQGGAVNCSTWNILK
jgi:agmatine/peptidylarginine deiminase